MRLNDILRLSSVSAVDLPGTEPRLRRCNPDGSGRSLVFESLVGCPARTRSGNRRTGLARSGMLGIRGAPVSLVVSSDCSCLRVPRVPGADLRGT